MMEWDQVVDAWQLESWVDDELVGAPEHGVEVQALDEALTALSKIDPRKGRVVEMRYFGGLSVEECAEVLEVSPETVMRDWRLARVWLFRELTRMGSLRPQ